MVVTPKLTGGRHMASNPHRLTDRTLSPILCSFQTPLNNQRQSRLQVVAVRVRVHPPDPCSLRPTYHLFPSSWRDPTDVSEGITNVYWACDQTLLFRRQVRYSEEISYTHHLWCIERRLYPSCVVYSHCDLQAESWVWAIHDHDHCDQ